MSIPYDADPTIAKHPVVDYLDTVERCAEALNYRMTEGNWITAYRCYRQKISAYCVMAELGVL